MAEVRGVSRVCERPNDGAVGVGVGVGLGAAGGRGSWDEQQRQELYVLEHERTMRLLALQECVWEGKRRAAKQKEKAARAKKLYYQAKLKRIGADVPPSSSSDDSDN